MASSLRRIRTKPRYNYMDAAQANGKATGLSLSCQSFQISLPGISHLCGLHLKLEQDY